MPPVLTAHFPTRNDIVLLVRWSAEDGDPPSDLEVVVDPGGSEEQSAQWDRDWLKVGASGRRTDGSKYWAVWRRTATAAISPGNPYVAVLQDADGTEWSRATFTALPAQLPSTDSGERATVLAGSCYYDGSDRGGKVSAHYAKLFADARYAPILKFFLGDQVYVDAPYTSFQSDDNVKDVNATEKWVTNRYDRSMGQLDPLLQVEANVCITDDHDYWNDFPNAPFRLAWPALQDPLNRGRLRAVTRRFATEVQLARPTWSTRIGDEVSLFVADTRMNRRSGQSNFMEEADFNSLINWIAKLDRPGVLILGQPIFSAPNSLAPLFGLEKNPELYGTIALAAATGALTTTGLASLVLAGKLVWEIGEEVAGWLGIDGDSDDPPSTVTDRNLPAYAQYGILEFMIANSAHDLLILAGDPHFGRVAKVKLLRRDGSDPTTIYEVISSPMALLPGAANVHDNKDVPARWPTGYLVPPGVRRGTIQTLLQLPTFATTRPKVWESKRGTSSHFATLGFSRRDATLDTAAGVDVEVTFWSTKELDGQGMPKLLGQTRIGLDTGRIRTDGAGPVKRLVTHVFSVPSKPRVVAALGNPGEPWSPRYLQQVLHDLDNGLAISTTVWLSTTHPRPSPRPTGYAYRTATEEHTCGQVPIRTPTTILITYQNFRSAICFHDAPLGQGIRMSQLSCRQWSSGAQASRRCGATLLADRRRRVTQMR